MKYVYKKIVYYRLGSLLLSNVYLVYSLRRISTSLTLDRGEYDCILGPV